MKIAIIGAGFTGLAAASDLIKAGHEVHIFEVADQPGGLAAGFTASGWEWSLEHHYHHIFTSDKDILGWLDELGLGQEAFFQSVKTSWLYQGKQFQFDSPVSLLRCPVLSWPAKVRVAFTLAYLRFLPVWKQLEKTTAEQFLLQWMGEEGYTALFKPLLEDKFGKYASAVTAAWFWARIHVRSPKLGYFKGGFGKVAALSAAVLAKQGVKLHLGSKVTSIERSDSVWSVIHQDTDQSGATSTQEFDAVLVTLSAGVLKALVPTLPAEFVQKITHLTGLAATTLVLELDQPFFADKTYWLSVNEQEYPFLAVVEHTNLIDKQQYGGKTLVYVGKYLVKDNPLYAMESAELLKTYAQYLEKLSPGFAKHVTRHWVWKAPFAQPVVGVNYSQHAPKIETPFPGLYWASMQHVYPFDRGTNYAVQIGRKAAAVLTKSMAAV